VLNEKSQIFPKKQIMLALCSMQIYETFFGFLYVWLNSVFFQMPNKFLKNWHYQLGQQKVRVIDLVHKVQNMPWMLLSVLSSYSPYSDLVVWDLDYT